MSRSDEAARWPSRNALDAAGVPGVALRPSRYGCRFGLGILPWP